MRRQFEHAWSLINVFHASMQSTMIFTRFILPKSSIKDAAWNCAGTQQGTDQSSTGMGCADALTLTECQKADSFAQTQYNVHT